MADDVQAAIAGPLPGPGDGAVVARDLRKTFGRVDALRGVSFAVRRGEIFGLLGPNGAGKTTLQQILCTLLQPTSGDAWIAGASVTRQGDAVRRKLGVVFQERSLERQMSATENLRIHGRLYKVPSADVERRIPDLLALAQLQDRADDRVQNFSGGMKRRLELVRAMLHQPDVLLLDEPTTGLDPQSRRILWERIRLLQRQQSVTVLLTTHYMDEAEELCDRVAIIDHGQIISLGSPASLKDKLGGDWLDLVLAGPAKPFLQAATAVPGVVDAFAVGPKLRVRLRQSGATIPLVLSALNAAGARVVGMQHRPLSMDDVFLEATGKVRDKPRKRRGGWRALLGMGD